MTVSTQQIRVTYLGDGTSTNFTIPWMFYAATDIGVFIGGNPMTVGYSVAGAGTGTGTLNMAVAPADGVSVQILLNVPLTQLVALGDGTAFPSATLNQVNDRAMQAILRMQDQINRCIKAPDGDVSPAMALPVAAARANLLQTYDAQGNLSLAMTIPAGTLTQTVFNQFLAISNVLAQVNGVTGQESGAGITPSNLGLFLPPAAQRYGAKFNGLTDDTASIVQAVALAGSSYNGTQGSEVTLPQGLSLLSSMVFLPNRVRVVGVNKRGSSFQATPGWSVGNGVSAYSSGTVYSTDSLVTSSGVLYISRQSSNSGNTPSSSPTFWTAISNAMFYAQNGYSAGAGISMFDSTLENLTVDCNNVAGLGGVLSSAWQEDCGLRAALILNFSTYGVRLQDGFGGASFTRISDTEIFGGTTANAIGVDLQEISLVGSFLLKVSDTSITGSPGAALAKGINVVNDSLHADTVHFEQATSAIYLDGVGHHVIIGCTGGPGVTSLVELASTFAGTLTMLECFRNGATNLIKDNRSGGLGTISYDLDHVRIDATANLPSRSPGSVWMAGIFNGSGGVSSFTGMNANTPVRNSAGNYTIASTRTGGANRSAGASCGLANATVQTSVSAGSINIIISVAGTPTDSNEIHFWDIILQ